MMSEELVRQVMPELRIDFALLREQKARICGFPMMMSEDEQALDGVLQIIDEIQDQCVRAGVLTEEQVFGKEE